METSLNAHKLATASIEAYTTRIGDNPAAYGCGVPEYGPRPQPAVLLSSGMALLSPLSACVATLAVGPASGRRGGWPARVGGFRPGGYRVVQEIAEINERARLQS